MNTFDKINTSEKTIGKQRSWLQAYTMTLCTQGSFVVINIDI